jgi:hypothetical protein
MVAHEHHEFIKTKIHGLVTVYTCARCGCEKVIKADATTMYRPREHRRWGLFRRWDEIPPPCIVHVEQPESEPSVEAGS